jgi:hypothetical protein
MAARDSGTQGAVVGGNLSQTATANELWSKRKLRQVRVKKYMYLDERADIGRGKRVDHVPKHDNDRVVFMVGRVVHHVLFQVVNINGRLSPTDQHLQVTPSKYQQKNNHKI